MKDKVFLGSELFIGKLIYLPKHSDTILFLDYDKDKRKHVFLKDNFIDYVRYLKNLGVNAFRALLPYHEPVDIYDKEGDGKLEEYEFFLPFKYNRKKKKWDLDKFDEQYFEILKEMIEIIVDGGNTYFVLPIVDHCMFNGKNGALYKNIQGVYLYTQEILPYIYKLIDKYIDVLNPYLDNIIWELGNEIRLENYAFEVYEYLMKKKIKPELISLGINLNLNPNDVYGNDMKKLREKIRNKYGVKHLRKSFFVIHGHLRKDHPSGFGSLTYWAMTEAEWIQRKDSPSEKYNIRTFISTDGTGDGDSECDVHPRKTAQYRRRPSFKQWERFLDVLYEDYYLTSDDGLPLIYLEQFIKVQSKDCQGKFWKNMAKLYKKHFGEYPYNYGKFPPLECKEGEIKYKKCPDGSKVIKKKCENGKWIEINEKCPQIEPEKDCSCINYLKTSIWQMNFKAFFLCLIGIEEKKCI